MSDLKLRMRWKPWMWRMRLRKWKAIGTRRHQPFWYLALGPFEWRWIPSATAHDVSGEGAALRGARASLAPPGIIET